MATSKYDLELTLTTDAKGKAWSAAPSVLSEREYQTAGGLVRIRFDWAAVRDEPFTPVSLDLVDERQDADARDLPAFVELFFHDVFLMFNLAAPGSFGGVVTAAGGEYGVREVALDPWVFEYAAAEALPLGEVVRWYDSLGVGTRQIATGGAAAALFHLLHLARVEEEDVTSIVRLSLASEALALPRDARLFELRDAIVSGTAPVIHPMYDDSLDSRVEDSSFDWSDAIDRAANGVIGALQRQIRGA